MWTHLYCSDVMRLDVNEKELVDMKDKADDVQNRRNETQPDDNDVAMVASGGVDTASEQTLDTVPASQQLADGSVVVDNDDVTCETDVLKNSAETRATSSQDTSRCRLCQAMVTLVSGWRTYVRQSVVFAGVSLAMLYMTVLGFDSITVGNSLSQSL